ncbi:hypothetical protein NE237_007844 [Protea cynaroides]|uniref:Uncharacterized protein n=1 Tax=Protea cynaroides TaxID=273540 RepID=A0A9Q0QWV0_9MAGN|nr:hypothetical protein NE237_007844 [Protea cynaroides]
METVKTDEEVIIPQDLAKPVKGGVSKFNEKNPSESFKSSSRKKKMNWFSWSRIRIKKSTTKTVPVDSSGIKEPKHKDSDVIVDRKPGIAEIKSAKTIALGQSDNQKPKKANKHGRAHNIILQSRAQLDSSCDTCCKPVSLENEPESSASQTGSPAHKCTCTDQAQPSNQSVPSNSRKPARLAGSSQPHAKQPASQNNAGTGKFSPMAGLSVVMVTLVLLLIFGRLCAILCTSVWFYAAPRLMAVKSDDSATSRSASDLPDLSSEEYKKRVVLEGLLERKHRLGNLHRSH